jgi:hypothetical protein
MKRKPAGSNHKVIDTFLMNEGSASAAQIKRATKVKGNIYQTMNKMVALGLVEKVGKVYVTTDSSIDGKNVVKPQPKKTETSPTRVQLNAIQVEIDYVNDGIDMLSTTLNYLYRRRDQLVEDLADESV